jgi:hypothetical protein
MRDASNLTGLTALVTGASSGIGLQFCYRLAEGGAVIVMVSNQEDELRMHADEIAQHYKVCTFAVPMDLTEPDAAQRLLQFCDDNGLRVDMLINNAGIFAFDLLHNISPAKIHCFIDLHIRALTDMCYIFGERMKNRGTGYILNMSSMSCWMPMPGLAMYSSTKAYIRAFSRSLHYELSDYGVSVTVACPGGIATDLFGLPDNLKRLAVNIKALDTPERFTRLALNKMLARKQQYINGLLNRISIFLIGITPKWVRMLVKHKLLDKNIRRP